MEESARIARIGSGGAAGPDINRLHRITEGPSWRGSGCGYCTRESGRYMSRVFRLSCSSLLSTLALAIPSVALFTSIDTKAQSLTTLYTFCSSGLPCTDGSPSCIWRIDSRQRRKLLRDDV